MNRIVLIFCILFLIFACVKLNECDNVTKEQLEKVSDYINNKNDFISARAYYNANITRNNKCYYATYYDIVLLTLENNYTKAYKITEYAIRKYPDKTDLYALKGFINLNTKKFKQALDDCSIATSSNPRNDTALNCIAIAQFNLKNFKSAIKYFNKSLSVKQSKYINHLYLALAYGQPGNADKTKSIKHLRIFLQNYKFRDSKYRIGVNIFKKATGKEWKSE